MEHFFEHLALAFSAPFKDRDEVYFQVGLTGIEPADPREIVRTMAELTAHAGSGGCDCGCGWMTENRWIRGDVCYKRRACTTERVTKPCLLLRSKGFKGRDTRVQLHSGNPLGRAPSFSLNPEPCNL